MRFLFVDRILTMDDGPIVRGIKHVTADDYYLCSSEDGRTCFIPSLVGEALGQLVAWRVMQYHNFTKRPVAGIVSEAYLYRPAYVGETLQLEARIISLDDVSVNYQAVASVGDFEVFRLDGVLGPLLPMEDFIDPDLARQQCAEINRPGVWPLQFAASTCVDRQDLAQVAPRCAPMCFDRWLIHEAGVMAVVEKRITRAAVYFPDHFPNKPVLPLSVLLECILDAVRSFVKTSDFAKNYGLHEIRKIKMSEFVSPGSIVVSSLRVKQLDEEKLVIAVRTEVEGMRVCVLEVVMQAVEKQ